MDEAAPKRGRGRPKGKGIPINKTAVAARHKKLFSEIGKGKTVEEAAKSAGLSVSYARSHGLNKTKQWQEALAKFLPEDYLLDTLNKQTKMGSIDTIDVDILVEDEEIEAMLRELGCLPKKIIARANTKHVIFLRPDGHVRNKAVELGLKAHKRLTDRVELEDVSPLRSLTDEELRAREERLRKFYRKEVASPEDD